MDKIFLVLLAFYASIIYVHTCGCVKKKCFFRYSLAGVSPRQEQKGGVSPRREQKGGASPRQELRGGASPRQEVGGEHLYENVDLFKEKYCISSKKRSQCFSRS